MVARAARESGVPISDILENLPNELSVWVDPGEVSFRIGEKGAVKVSTYEEESYIYIYILDQPSRYFNFSPYEGLYLTDYSIKGLRNVVKYVLIVHTDKLRFKI